LINLITKNIKGGLDKPSPYEYENVGLINQAPTKGETSPYKTIDQTPENLMAK
jgi:hypothetical protein